VLEEEQPQAAGRRENQTLADGARRRGGRDGIPAWRRPDAGVAAAGCQGGGGRMLWWRRLGGVVSGRRKPRGVASGRRKTASSVIASSSDPRADGEPCPVSGDVGRRPGENAWVGLPYPSALASKWHRNLARGQFPRGLLAPEKGRDPGGIPCCQSRPYRISNHAARSRSSLSLNNDR
jgi:hypothetical protein